MWLSDTASTVQCVLAQGFPCAAIYFYVLTRVGVLDKGVRCTDYQFRVQTISESDICGRFDLIVLCLLCCYVPQVRICPRRDTFKICWQISGRLFLRGPSIRVESPDICFIFVCIVYRFSTQVYVSWESQIIDRAGIRFETPRIQFKLIVVFKLMSR